MQKSSFVASPYNNLKEYLLKRDKWSFKRRPNRGRNLKYTSKTFERCSASTTDEARLDVSICQFYIIYQVLFLT